MKVIEKQVLTGERALFSSTDIEIRSTLFCDGESPLKESRGIKLFASEFGWKYPLWYCRDIECIDCRLADTARSGIWYTSGIRMERCQIDAPKTFRRSSSIELIDSAIPNAQETLWGCTDVRIKNLQVAGDYFGMNCSCVQVDNLTINGNYIFDGGRDIVVRNSRLISKDAFWNCENVTVIDSVIVGEYLGWNTKNLTLIRCRIESDQGLCYIDGLTLEDCIISESPLSFEYSTVDASFEVGENVSIKNPISGRILVKGQCELILEQERIDPSKTNITFSGEYDEF